MSKIHLFDDEGPSKGSKIMLATTVYDKPDASYVASIHNARQALRDDGHLTAYLLLEGNCHVDDARNQVVAQFLKTDCTDLVFIDADVSFKSQALVELCGHISVDIVGGVYPKRSTTSDEMPVRMCSNVFEPADDGLMEVVGLPTGFMRIRRHVLEVMSQQARQHTKGGDLNTMIPILFERDWVEGVGRRGGDIAFCMNARDAGFEVHADCDLVLGHAAKVIVKGSLGAALRKQKGTTLKYVADLISSSDWEPEHIDEAITFVCNTWSADGDSLIAALAVIAEEPGPVLEVGSGLSTILMAAANRSIVGSKSDCYVYALEHDPVYVELTKRMAKQAGVKNIGLCYAPIDPRTNWYSVAEMEGLPEKYRLGFCDGPPRAYKSRMTFFDGGYADACEVIIADDATDKEYQRGLLAYAKERGRDIEFVGRIAIIK